MAEFLDLVMAQLTDPFRIGLLTVMLFTARNTAAQMGYALPLTLGIVFVAVVIPTALGSGTAGMAYAVAAGILSNAVIVAALAAIWMAVRKLMPGAG